MLDSRDPYLEDRRKLDLAWRLLLHGARTQTISHWTGLSARKVRSLLKRYRARLAEFQIQRPRGDSPFNMELLMRSPRRRVEAALFATIHQDLLVQAGLQTRAFRSDLSTAELVCEAYEALQKKQPQSGLSIERAFLVLSAVKRTDEFWLGPCPRCKTPMLIDRLAVAPRRCENCSAPINPSGHLAEVESERPTSLPRDHVR
jgi:hypothetical protein